MLRQKPSQFGVKFVERSSHPSKRLEAAKILFYQILLLKFFPLSIVNLDANFQESVFFLQKHRVHVALGLVNLLLFGQARV